jgi:predicted Zn-dependent peptidase
VSAGGFIIRILTLLLLGVIPNLGAQEIPEVDLPVREATLANGLRLFVLPRPGPPTVSFVVQYPIGSVNEIPGATGMAHLLEHMLFKGTTSVGTRDYQAEAPLLDRMDRLYDSILMVEDSLIPDTVRTAGFWKRIEALEDSASELVTSNEFNEILSRNGAVNLNAVTTTESTTYFVDLPSNRAELWFVLEADRMRNPVFREFFREREVVTEERRLRLDNNPVGLLSQAQLAAAFPVHPYGAPVVGYMSDLQRISRPQMESYFRRFYGPNNAVLAIVGNVAPDQIFQWAQAYLGPIPPGESPPPIRIREPEQMGERRVEVVYDAESMVRVGWKVPSIRHGDSPALHMLASLLTGGRRSRIYRRLVLEDRIASGVASITEPGQLYPGLFVIEASPISPHTPREVESAIYEELEKLAAVPPEPGELQRVRNQLEAGEVRRLGSNFGLAFQLAGSATLFGDWRETFTFSRRLQEVSPHDIQEVVKRYFRKELRTVATLVKPSDTGEEGR